MLHANVIVMYTLIWSKVQFIYICYGSSNVKPESLNTVDFIRYIVLCVLSSNLSVCNCVVLETVMHVVRSLRDGMKGGRNKGMHCDYVCLHVHLYVINTALVTELMYFKVSVLVLLFPPPMIKVFFMYFRGQIVQLPKKWALHQFKVQ